MNAAYDTAVKSSSTIDPFAAELWWYFGLDLPEAPGSGSTFHAMCNRLERQRKDSPFRPTPFRVLPNGVTVGAPWTELIDCSGHHGGDAKSDDAMVEYLDRRRAGARVRSIVEQLTADDHAVLEAYFANWELDAFRGLGHYRGVAKWARTAILENRRAALKGQLEAVDATVVALLERACGHDRRASAAREKVQSIRQEAAALVSAAFERYVHLRGAAASK